MTKITKNWINRDFNDPNGLTAADIPLSDRDNIKTWLDFSDGIQTVNDPSTGLISTKTVYATPSGTGDGESVGSPSNLETLRQRFTGRKTAVTIKLLAGGEYVLHDRWHVTNGSVVSIEFDHDNATLDWDNDPPIICTQHTTTPYISFDVDDSRTCAAHDYNEKPFTVDYAALSLSDVVVRGTMGAVSASSGATLSLNNKFRIEVWAPKAALNSVCYALSTMNPTSALRLMSRGNATAFSDRCGIYMYPTLPADQGNYYKAIAVASGACCYIYDGYLNFYSAHKPSISSSLDAIGIWNKAQAMLYSPSIKHTNFDNTIRIFDGRLSLGVGTTFEHDYDPAVSDNRSPIVSFINALGSVVSGEFSSANASNVHYTTGPFLDLKNSMVVLKGITPPFAAVGTVDSGVHCNTVTGRLSYLKCDDVTYGTYNIPIYLVHSSDIMLDYENWATVTMNGDPTSPYAAFVAAHSSRLEVNGNPTTPTIYSTNKAAGLFQTFSGGTIYERVSDTKFE